jgi:hypothetical protein
MQAINDLARGRDHVEVDQLRNWLLDYWVQAGGLEDEEPDFGELGELEEVVDGEG